jgi:hypothetical protein
MTTKRALLAAGVIACGTTAAPAFAAEYLMLNDPSLSTGFEQRWNDPNIWSLQSGVDDGGNGIPDGTDTFIINRNTGGFSAGATDLSNEGMPNGHTVAGITATGAAGRDIVLKTADVVIGDLTVLASPDTFEIFAERDRDVTINGVISGSGDLLLTRSGGFSGPDGVTPDDIILLTGASPNTFTGNFSLNNSNASGNDAYFVADKAAAFGSAATLTLGGNPAGGISQLEITSNAAGDAISDTTAVSVNNTGEFKVDAGINENIGSGLLTVDGVVIADGVYTSAESWIVGDGTITVIPEPSSLALLGLGGLLIARRRRG